MMSRKAYVVRTQPQMWFFLTRAHLWDNQLTFGVNIGNDNIWIIVGRECKSIIRLMKHRAGDYHYYDEVIRARK